MRFKYRGEESEEGEWVLDSPGCEPRRISAKNVPFAYTYARYASGRTLPDRLAQLKPIDDGKRGSLQAVDVVWRKCN